jgi:hypothetical protein
MEQPRHVKRRAALTSTSSFYAHRMESPEHERYEEWLTRTAQGPKPFAVLGWVPAASYAS